MRGNRLKHTLGLLLSRSAGRRAEYLRKHGVFAHMGKGCTFQRPKVPLYPELISIGDNVHIAAGVSFVTHDITHIMLNRASEQGRFQERIGCIEIGNNVFVGSGAIIMFDTKIGSNVIIGTGSIVTRDIPDNSVAAGVPARVIGTFDDYMKKCAEEEMYPQAMAPKRQEISPELARWCWDKFKEKRND